MSKVATSQEMGSAACLVLAFAVGIGGTSRAARADDKPGSPDKPARQASPPAQNSPPAPDTLILARTVPGEPPVFGGTVPLKPKEATLVVFPGSMTVTNHRAIKSAVEYIRIHNWLFLSGAAGARLGATATVEVSIKGFAPVSIPVRIVRDITSEDRVWTMLPASKLEAMRDAQEAAIQARVTAAVEAALAEQAAELARQLETVPSGLLLARLSAGNA